LDPLQDAWDGGVGWEIGLAEAGEFHGSVKDDACLKQSASFRDGERCEVDRAEAVGFRSGVEAPSHAAEVGGHKAFQPSQPLATSHAAEEGARQTIYRKTLGPESVEAVGLTVNIAAELSKLGEFDEALEKFEEALGIQRRTLGDEHPDVAKTLCRWRCASRRLGTWRGVFCA